jgi:hypothetical protein
MGIKALSTSIMLTGRYVLFFRSAMEEEGAGIWDVWSLNLDYHFEKAKKLRLRAQGFHGVALMKNIKKTLDFWLSLNQVDRTLLMVMEL